jgi:flagellar secretion chaperone FliS
VNWKTRYIESRILSADPIGLVCILYEHAELAVEEARESIARKDIASRSRAISKAIAIIGELEGSLNLEVGGEIAANLARLYRYMRERLLVANMKQDAQPLQEVAQLLRTMAEAWEQIRPKNASDSMVPDSGAAGSAWPGASDGEALSAFAVHG